MTTTNSNKVFDVMHPICCGLDVHKRTISACLLITHSDGHVESQIEEFETFTDELFRLRDWLLENNCHVVAMESTSVYWQPVYNVLEGSVEVELVNARHTKHVPGRKTDIEDCQWLANLLRNGLTKSSFIPSKETRQQRDLTRLRKKYSQCLADYKRRTQKLFESANIKISSVATDLFGTTGRALMRLLISKSKITYEDVEACAKGRLVHKVQELYRSIQGFFEQHHRFILEELLSTVEFLEAKIAKLDAKIEELLKENNDIIERLDEVPGINRVAACSLLSELGDTLETFPNSQALASWAGVCPGNNESAGKRYSGKTRVKKHPLKTLLVEIAWAAVKKKGSYYQAKYYRLKARRGAKRAIIAIAHRILKAIYHIIKHGDSYRELGDNYLDERTRSYKLRKLKAEAKTLGYRLVPINS